jgi:hypothetical protein
MYQQESNVTLIVLKIPSPKSQIKKYPNSGIMGIGFFRCYQSITLVHYSAVRMFELTKSSKRTPPDLLAKLCKQYGVRVLELVGNGSKITRHDSLRIKLISYYTRSEVAWSRERERKDWSQHDLASLKYDTLRLLIRILSEENTSIGVELNEDLREIEWAIENHLYAPALELCRNALNRSSSREDFLVALKLLRYEEQIWEHIIDNEKSKQFRIIEENRKRCLDLITEQELCFSLKRKYFNPIKSQWEADEIIPESLIVDFENEIQIIEEKGLSCISSKVIFFASKFLLLMLRRAFFEAIATCEELLGLYERSEWVMAQNFSNYISHLKAACLLYSVLNEKEKAARKLAQIKSQETKSSIYAHEVRFSWMYCSLSISRTGGDKTESSRLIEMVRTLPMDFFESIGERKTIAILWEAVITCLNHKDFRIAHQIGNQLLSRKSSLKSNIIVNLRIILFACEVIIFNEESRMVESFFSATLKYLDRKKGTFPNARIVLRKFFDAWIQHHTPKIKSRNAARRQPEGSLFATFSGNVGYFDFSPLLAEMKEQIKSNRSPH